MAHQPKKVKRYTENEYHFYFSMRKVFVSLFAAVSLVAPILMTGCQMGSEEKTEQHDNDNHKDDHKGDHHGHDH